MQDQTVVTTTPITYRFGAPLATPLFPGTTGTPCATLGGCWTDPVTTTGPASIPVNPVPVGNPVLNTPKELDVLQTSVAQSMMVDETLVTVPALDGSTTPPAPRQLQLRRPRPLLSAPMEAIPESPPA